MNRLPRPPAVLFLVVFSTCLGLVSICGRDLAGHDGPRVAGIARAMALSGDYAVPRLNGTPFLEYPSLGYVPAALALKLASPPGDFLPLAASVLAGIATVFLTYRMGRLLGGPGVGLRAGFLLAVTAGFFNLNRRCLVDPWLLFWITLSLYGLLAAIRADRPSLRRTAIFYVGMAAALLTKGLIGVAVPLATAGAFVLWCRDASILRKLRPFSGVVLFAIPLVLWGFAAQASCGPEAWKEVFRQSVWRFSSQTAHHSAPLTYYALPALYVLLPGTLLVPAFPWILRGAGRLAGGRGAAFPAIWFTVTLLGLSAASAKRHIYLAPLFPAFALVCALFWDKAARIRPRLRKLEPWMLLVMTVILAAAHFFVLLPRDLARSVRPAFDVVRREAAHSRVIIHNPTEGFRGAAVFYLGRTVQETFGPRELDDALAEGGDATILVSYAKTSPPFGKAAAPQGLRLIFERKLATRLAVNVYSYKPPGRGAGR